MNDNIKMMNDLQTIMEIIAPDTDLVKLSVRMEEVLANYNVAKRSREQLEADVEENVAIFLNAMRIEGLSDRTIEGYMYQLRMFANYVNKATAHITTADIRNFLGSFKEVKLSTLATKLSTLKSFFGWLVREEVLLRDPTAKVRLPKKEKRLPKGLSIEELETVRESCDSLRQRAIIEFLYSTGCRLDEVYKLNISDINTQAMSVRVIGKGNKERVVYLSFKAIYHLKKYLNSRNDDCEALFVTERRPFRRVGHRAIQRIIDKVAVTSNISKNLTPHVMRHTFATLSADSGIDLADLQQLMGHSNPSTTLIYANVSEERKQAAFKRYHVQ